MDYTVCNAKNCEVNSYCIRCTVFSVYVNNVNEEAGFYFIYCLAFVKGVVSNAMKSIALLEFSCALFF